MSTAKCSLVTSAYMAISFCTVLFVFTGCQSHRISPQTQNQNNSALKTEFINLSDWSPPNEFADFIAIEKFFNSLPNRFESHVSKVEESNLVLVEVRDNWVDDTPSKLAIIYAFSGYEKVFRRRLQIPTKRHHPLRLRILGPSKFELIEFTPSGGKSLGIILDAVHLK